MPHLDPHMAEILRIGAEQNFAPYETMTAAEARAAAEERNRVWNEDSPAVGRVEDVEVPGSGGPRRLRIYEPKGNPPAGFARVPVTLEDAYLVLMRLGELSGIDANGVAAGGAR